MVLGCGTAAGTFTVYDTYTDGQPSVSPIAVPMASYSSVSYLPSSSAAFTSSSFTSASSSIYISSSLVLSSPTTQSIKNSAPFSQSQGQARPNAPPPATSTGAAGSRATPNPYHWTWIAVLAAKRWL